MTSIAKTLAEQPTRIWVAKLLRRLLSLPPGRYTITLTVGQTVDWTVTPLGKVEK